MDTCQHRADKDGRLFKFVKFRLSWWVPRGRIWKFVTLDCRKMHFQTPEQLKMSFKNSSTTTLYDAKNAQKPKPNLVNVVFSTTSLNIMTLQGSFFLEAGGDGPNYINHLTIFLKLFCWFGTFFSCLGTVLLFSGKYIMLKAISFRRMNCLCKLLLFFQCHSQLRNLIFMMSIVCT